MNKVLALILILSSSAAFTQGFVNGSFELTTSSGCDYNNSIPDFNAVMDNVVMFDGTETDIQEAGCYIPTIPEGVKVVGIANTDAINLELSETLVEGNAYTVTFSLFGNTSFGPIGTVQLGATLDELVEGIFIGTADPILADTWEVKTVTFVAPNNATHISVKNTEIGVWHQLDDFSIELACSPIEIDASEIALCFDEELILTATGTGDITWEDGIVNGEGFIPETTGTITYNVTSDSEVDCPNSIEIEVYALPEVTASVDFDAICIGDSIILNGGGADSYEWSPITIEDGEVYIPEAGEYTYTVIGTDDETGCENTADLEVTVFVLPEVSATATDEEICLGESITLNGEGAITYSWDPEEEDGVEFTPDATGVVVYTVQGIDDNGCVNEASIEISVYEELEITYTTTDEIFGSDGEIDITVTGGNPAYIFDWDNDGTGDWDDDEDLADLVAGTYIVDVEDEAGCTESITFIVASQVSLVEENLQAFIFPNPTKGDLTIVYNGTFNYTLSTIDGKELFKGIATNQKLVSLEAYADGVYYVTVMINKQRNVYKVIKQ